MNGIDWRTIGNPTFERITDTLLSLEYGSSGRPIEGRGGEGETPGDYSVDDGRIIFEYKYFPEGFPAGGPRQKEIKKSLAQVLKKREPEEWILVVPTKLTFWEQKFMSRLASESGLKINYRDKVWLDTQLGLRPDLSNYFRHYSDNDYLQTKAEQFKQNPIIRDAADLAERVRLLMAVADDADPDWTYEISSRGGNILQTLVPKHANAPLFSPVSLTFKTLLPAGSAEAKELQEADAFGYRKPISIPGKLIKDFAITGPPLVAWSGEVSELQLLPQQPGEWVDTDLTLTNEDGDVLGNYLTKSHGVGSGRSGYTFEVALGSLLSLTFQAPYESGGSGRVDFSFADVTGTKISEVLEATDFVCQLPIASRLEISVGDSRLALIDIQGKTDQPWMADYRQSRSVAEDLLVIESQTKARFRYPARIDAEERVMIRNLRLMFEGHCVAHPTWTTINAELTGQRDSGLDGLLTLDPKWMLRTSESAMIPLLGQNLSLKNLGIGGVFGFDPGHLQNILSAFEEGTANGMSIQMRCRPGDRIRMFLGDHFNPSQPLEITPWGIDGIKQKGLTAAGDPVTS